MRRTCALGILLFSLCTQTHADGGRLRFSEVAGPFLVTLFTTPEPLTAGPVDASILVQDAATYEVLSDVGTTMRWTGPGGTQLTARASPGVATNRLMQAAVVDLPVPGQWHLRVDLQQETRTASCDADFIVVSGSRRAVVIWTFALLPVFAVLLFVLHQRQKGLLRARTIR